MTETAKGSRSSGRTSQRWPVGKASELEPGAFTLVEVKKLSIGVYNVHGEYLAFLNICPHELAPVCRGRLGGTTLPSKPGEYRWGRDGEILACPWHGWEFDLMSGKMIADERIRLRQYPVEIEDDTIFVVI